MATFVYWNDLNANGDWADPGNWSFDQAGTSPLGSFSGDEYFLWGGTTSGASDGCSLLVSVTCSGLDMTGNTGGVAVVGGTLNFANFSDADAVSAGTPNGVMAYFTGSNSVNEHAVITSTGIVGEQYTFGGFASWNGPGLLDFTQNHGDIFIDDISMSVNGALDNPQSILLSGNGSTLTFTADTALDVVEATGQSAFDAGGATPSFVILPKTFSVRNYSSLLFSSQITPTFWPTGDANVTLSIGHGPFSSAVPQWAVDSTKTGGTLILDFARQLPTLSGTDINGEWTGLDILGAAGVAFAALRFNASITTSHDVPVGYKFTGASPVTVETTEFRMETGSLNTTAMRVYSAGANVRLKLDGGDFRTQVSGNIQFGLGFDSDTLTCSRFFAPGVQGWDSTGFARNVVIAGPAVVGPILGDVSLGTNAFLDTLSCTETGRPVYFVGRPAVSASAGSLILTLTGKLNLPANDLLFNTIPVGTYRINLGTGATTADVAVITGEIKPWA